MDVFSGSERCHPLPLPENLVLTGTGKKGHINRSARGKMWNVAGFPSSEKSVSVMGNWVTFSGNPFYSYMVFDRWNVQIDLIKSWKIRICFI